MNHKLVLKDLNDASKLVIALVCFLLLAVLFVSGSLRLVTFHKSNSHQSIKELLKMEYAYPRLQSAVLGNMNQYLQNTSEKDSIIRWIDKGFKRQEYYLSIYPIIEKSCIQCHGNGVALGSVTLRNYGELLPLVSRKGKPLKKLLSHTHYHLFGLLMILGFSAFTFSLSSLISQRKKRLFIALSFVFLLLDIAGWWLPKLCECWWWVTFVGGIGFYIALFFFLLFPFIEVSRSN